MLGRDQQMQPGYVDFPKFAHGFDFASRETTSESRKFSKTHQVGFHQDCDTGVVYLLQPVSHTCTSSDRDSWLHQFHTIQFDKTDGIT